MSARRDLGVRSRESGKMVPNDRGVLPTPLFYLGLATIATTALCDNELGKSQGYRGSTWRADLRCR